MKGDAQLRVFAKRNEFAKVKVLWACVDPKVHGNSYEALFRHECAQNEVEMARLLSHKVNFAVPHESHCGLDHKVRSYQTMP